MAAIAYISDGKMLELHRLNRNSEMNFWRLSSKNNFRQFNVGDLLFFLSKDKRHSLNGEKGIIGYGRCESFFKSNSEAMWNKFETKNGYRNKIEFKNALKKLTKDKKLPKQISSIYLNDAVFFQAPIFLSECGYELPSQVESYIYLNDEIPLKILSFAKESPDIWTMNHETEDCIDKEICRYHLNQIINKYNPIPLSNNQFKEANRLLKEMHSNDQEIYLFADKIEAYKIMDKEINIYFPKLKGIDDRIFIGQAYLINQDINKYHDRIKLNFYFVKEGELIKW